MRQSKCLSVFAVFLNFPLVRTRGKVCLPLYPCILIAWPSGLLASTPPSQHLGLFRKITVSSVALFNITFPCSPVRFRFYQKYSDMQWGIDNLYIGPGCMDNCNGHGDCLKEQCICDPGYSGPNCYLSHPLKASTIYTLVEIY